MSAPQPYSQRLSHPQRSLTAELIRDQIITTATFWLYVQKYCRRGCFFSFFLILSRLRRKNKGLFYFSVTLSASIARTSETERGGVEMKDWQRVAVFTDCPLTQRRETGIYTSSTSGGKIKYMCLYRIYVYKYICICVCVYCYYYLYLFPKSGPINNSRWHF